MREFIATVTTFILSHDNTTKTQRDIRWVPTNINSADLITRRITTAELFEENKNWFKPAKGFDGPGIPTFDMNQGGLPMVDKTHECVLLGIGNSKKSKIKVNSNLHPFIESIFGDGKNHDKGVRITLYVNRFINKVFGNREKPKILQNYKNIRQYLEKTEKCNCSVCKINIKHKLPEIVSSFVQEKIKPVEMSSLGLLDGNCNIDANGPSVSRIEYQTTFLVLLKLSQEKAYRTQIASIMDNKMLPYEDTLKNVEPFINEETGLLQARGRIGFNSEPHRELEYLQRHSNHYLLILPPHGSFVISYLLHIHETYACATERFMSLIVRETFHLPSPVRISKKSIRRCMLCIKRRSMENKLSVPIGNLPSYRLPSGDDREHNRPYNVVFWDIKGHLSIINDSYKTANKKKLKEKNTNQEIQRVKVYVIVFTCALTRHSTIDMIEDKSYESVKNAFVRFINRWGNPAMCVSDSDLSLIHI